METPKEARDRITADAVKKYDRLSPSQQELSAYVLKESKLDAEYITTDAHMVPSLSEEYAKALIEKYGHTELHSTVDDDMDDFGALPDTEDIPDEELDDFDYYGRHGFARTAPVCTDPDCPCDED